MLTCEGFWMFRGTCRITPINGRTPFTLGGTWLYRPDMNTWYCGGASFPADVVEVVEDETDGQVSGLNWKTQWTFDSSERS